MPKIKQLRIGLFHNLPGGGAKRSIYELCKGISKKGHRIDVFVPETANDKYLPLNSLGLKVQVYEIEALPKVPNLRPYVLERYVKLFQRWNYLLKHEALNKKIAKVMNKGKYDLMWVEKCFVASSPYILKYLKSPTVYFCQEPCREAFEANGREEHPKHNGSLRSRLKSLYKNFTKIPLELENHMLRSLEIANASKARKILANSFYSKEFIHKCFGRSPQVNYLGVDNEFFKPSGLKREQVVLSVGHLWESKRHELTIHAIAQIPSSQRPKFVIITEAKWSLGRAPKLRDLAHQLNVDLEILIGVSDEELLNWYNRARVVAYAAQQEPFGLVALEAMACGTPIVAAKEGGLQESIIDGETGLLTDPTAEACAQAIQKILENPRLSREMGNAGVEHIRKNWTWNSAVDRFEAHLHEVAKEGSNGR